MPEPTLGDVHVDQALTDFSLAYLKAKSSNRRFLYIFGSASPNSGTNIHLPNDTRYAYPKIPSYQQLYTFIDFDVVSIGSTCISQNP